ncbi:hypothetical protein FVEG_14085 [Fusarium verticillioides 7600]|uniref:Uncharacterized protein n=1 Tax=Gibberella moniliformis (strain M3125 / FGSC 7600) TaxID=334819 RepID=W7NHT1_GIBM7|nr:hypothetical protein FVEG_14085 [Fusarium verticillioides 7600]EWG55987.1 hypothetical protein FVEG_14085 [Fusarium verticillioides 7600]RBQ94550.1 hypothetical protein FVER53263_14085 [Fusarium verticillioides]
MSQPTDGTARGSVPFLPPELSLRIIEESEEAPICLVNHLSRGKLKCDGGFQDYTTVIYTRGEKQRDGTLSRGKLESLPMQHRCIAGVIRTSETPALPFDHSDGYSIELAISHLTKRTVVAELGMDEDIANPVLNLDKHAFMDYCPLKFINARYLGCTLLDRQFIATVPIEIGGDDNIRQLAGITRGNQTALTHRLRPDDDNLACEKIRNLMIRTNTVSYNVILRNLLMINNQLDKVRSVYRWSSNLCAYRDELVSSPLRPKWELLKNVDTLCIDMTGLTALHEEPLLGVQINKMARCLNLKTLILLGVPCLARYEAEILNEEQEGETGEDSWVACLEDNPYFRYEGTTLTSTNWLYLFKDLVRPGGRIHFIADMPPGSPYWPSPNASVEAIEDGLQ